jgi:hypothetical protein
MLKLFCLRMYYVQHNVLFFVILIELTSYCFERKRGQQNEQKTESKSSHNYSSQNNQMVCSAYYHLNKDGLNGLLAIT